MQGVSAATPLFVVDQNGNPQPGSWACVLCDDGGFYFVQADDAAGLSAVFADLNLPNPPPPIDWPSPANGLPPQLPGSTFDPSVIPADWQGQPFFLAGFPIGQSNYLLPSLTTVKSKHTGYPQYNYVVGNQLGVYEWYLPTIS